MPHGLSDKLKSLGAIIVNSKSDKAVCVDRKLITIASPLASMNWGNLQQNLVGGPELSTTCNNV
jgi:molecular chaperone Hsp31 and glyoxalase 3|tara:strand:+ start:13000 stop:13191 length:192 start_codon:yes stop_codon:yes gene_type:complete